MKNKPILLLDLSGPDGNSFALLYYVRELLKENGYSDEDVKRIVDDATSGDRSHLMTVLQKHVDIRDLSGPTE